MDEAQNPDAGSPEKPEKPAPAPKPPAAKADAPAKPAATATPAAKPAAARPTGPTISQRVAPVNKTRRRVVWISVWGFLVANVLMILRFFLPRAIFEPSTVFRVGFPSDYGLGVETKWQQQYRIWVVKNTERLFVIYARCTHLGCTPDWNASENKFKCPCHGSGYTPEGINFEGPAPRPMDRAHVELDPSGQILVDTSRLFKWPKGEKDEFNDPGAFIQV
ncbi:MAG TPA: Rieske 2Fe-2S domain-containing protein [Blastocatellia bacterium]|nr:Rieske 2Fe-2S domain-containing protein [Blastocatellia bacterium]